MNMLRNSLFAAVIVTLVCAAGCRNRQKTIPADVDVIESRADGSVLGWSNGAAQLIQAAAPASAPTRVYFVAGLGLLVAGGLAAIAGAKAMGVAGMALGCAISALGVVIARYPWAILIAFLFAVAALGAALFDRWRKQRELAKNQTALSAAAQVIQNLPEGKAIKQGLSDLGNDIADQVREVVTPIKDKLRLEGKI